MKMYFFKNPAKRSWVRMYRIINLWRVWKSVQLTQWNIYLQQTVILMTQILFTLKKYYHICCCKKKKEGKNFFLVMQITVTSFRQRRLWQTLTYQAVLAGRWASVPQRWPYRGWSHTHRQCSPRLGSRGQAACGAASPARSAAKNFGPESTINRETIRVKGNKSKFEMLWDV